MIWTILRKLVPTKIITKLLIREIRYKSSSYSREYHAYIWRPVVGDETLICEQEETNEYDRNAVSIMFDDCISKKVVGHVPFSWSKLAVKFLEFSNHRICVVVIGKRVNRSAGFDLEITVDYTFYGDSRVTTWLKKALERIR